MPQRVPGADRAAEEAAVPVLVPVAFPVVEVPGVAEALALAVAGRAAPASRGALVAAREEISGKAGAGGLVVGPAVDQALASGAALVAGREVAQGAAPAPEGELAPRLAGEWADLEEGRESQPERDQPLPESGRLPPHCCEVLAC